MDKRGAAVVEWVEKRGNLMKTEITVEKAAALVTIICAPLSLFLQWWTQKPSFTILLLPAAACLLWRNIRLKRQMTQQSKMLENTQQLGYPISTLQYLMDQKKRKLFNTYRINQARVTYRLDQTQPGQLVHQRVEYRFTGNNSGKKPILSHFMTVSKSVYSAFTQVRITGTDHIENRPLRVERKTLRGNLQVIEALFPERGIEPNQDFDFSIVLEWTASQQVDQFRYFILDPKNYSKDVGQLIIELDTDETRFERATKKILEVDRDTMDHTVIRNLTTTRKDGRIYLRNSVSPREGFIYLFQMRMNPAADSLPV